jgi:hypothetical protein
MGCASLHPSYTAKHIAQLIVPSRIAILILLPD